MESQGNAMICLCKLEVKIKTTSPDNGMQFQRDSLNSDQQTIVT